VDKLNKISQVFEESFERHWQGKLANDLSKITSEKKLVMTRDEGFKTNPLYPVYPEKDWYEGWNNQDLANIRGLYSNLSGPTLLSQEIEVLDFDQMKLMVDEALAHDCKRIIFDFRSLPLELNKAVFDQIPFEDCHALTPVHYCNAGYWHPPESLAADAVLHAPSALSPCGGYVRAQCKRYALTSPWPVVVLACLRGEEWREQTRGGALVPRVSSWAAWQRDAVVHTARVHLVTKRLLS